MSKTVTPEEEAKALELARQFVAGDYDGPDFYSDAVLDAFDKVVPRG